MVMKFGALVTKTIHIPGDERSRTNLGHGYPAHDESVIELHTFDSQATMEDWVKRQTIGRHPQLVSFTLIRYEELKYETVVSVSVKASP